MASGPRGGARPASGSPPGCCFSVRHETGNRGAQLLRDHTGRTRAHLHSPRPDPDPDPALTSRPTTQGRLGAEVPPPRGASGPGPTPGSSAQGFQCRREQGSHPVAVKVWPYARRTGSLCGSRSDGTRDARGGTDSSAFRARAAGRPSPGQRCRQGPLLGHRGRPPRLACGHTRLPSLSLHRPG